MNTAMEQSSFMDRREMISIYNLARGNKLNTLNFKPGTFPAIEVMGDGGVFINTYSVDYDVTTGLYMKSTYIVLDELYRPIQGYDETYVKIMPNLNLLKVSACVSMNGDYNIDYLINVDHATIITSFELRVGVDTPERIAHSYIVSEEYKDIQPIIQMIYSDNDTNGNGLSNDFIKKYMHK